MRFPVELLKPTGIEEYLSPAAYNCSNQVRCDQEFSSKVNCHVLDLWECMACQ